MEVKEVRTAKYKLPSDQEKSDAKIRIDKMRKEGEKLVKGMFEFVDAQGGWFDFSYRFFPGDPVRTVKIIHGEIVDLPMILVKHLNNVWKKVRVMPKEIGPNGTLISQDVQKFSRTRFTPVDMF